MIQRRLFELDPKPANGEQTKVCSNCGREQPLSAFYAAPMYLHDVGHCCSACRKEHDAVVRAFRRDGGYELYFRLQGGRCGIETCPATDDLCVDVEHRHMRVRGLLCRKCNIMLAQVERTDAVAKYLLGEHLRRNGND